MGKQRNEHGVREEIEATIDEERNFCDALKT